LFNYHQINMDQCTCVFCRVSCTIQTLRFHLRGHVFSEPLGTVKQQFFCKKPYFWSCKAVFIDCLANNMSSLYRIVAQWFQMQQFSKKCWISVLFWKCLSL
jgi:hypothetical protein